MSSWFPTLGTKDKYVPRMGHPAAGFFRGGKLVDDAGALSEAGGDTGRDGGDGRGRGKRGVFGVDGVGVVGAESEGFDGAGVGHEFGLPSVIGLIFLHSGFGGGVPTAVGFLAEVVRVDEGGLNLRDAFGVDGLLSAETPGAGCGLFSGAGAGSGFVGSGERRTGFR